MVKNVIISLLAAVLMASQDATAYCRGAMAFGIFAACLVFTCYIEDKYRQERARKRRMRRIRRRIAVLVAPKGEANERAV